MLLEPGDGILVEAYTYPSAASHLIHARTLVSVVCCRSLLHGHMASDLFRAQWTVVEVRKSNLLQRLTF